MTTTTPHIQNGPEPLLSRRRKKKMYGIIVAFALVITASVVWYARRDNHECAPGVKSLESANVQQCAGLTDGGYSFSKDLDHVYGLIKSENDHVTEEAAKPGGAPYVSVVYVLGMTPGDGDSNNVRSVRHEIEGAYTAQMQANHHATQGDSPRIRLLLGNIGSGTEARDYTLGQVKSHLTGDRIVAAVGLGTSLSDTRAMVSLLASWNIASFGSVLTADDLQKVRGLVRAAPPNADEATAAVQFLSTGKYAKSRVLVIEDANGKDLYTRTLAKTFRSKFPRGRLAAKDPMEYDSTKTKLGTYFTNQMANICGADPDVVYFAGRGRDLPKFIAPLAGRQCKKTVTVLSGDDVSQSPGSAGFDDVKQGLRNGNIRLIYTGLAHPGAWAKAPQFYSNTAIEPFQAGGTFTQKFPRDDLDDGQSIMAYDAMLTAVKAIRKAVPLEDSNQPVVRKDVMQMLKLLYDANAVAGASGWISYTNNGSPKDKAIPVIEVDASGSTKTIEVTSGTGKPYTHADSPAAGKQ